MVVDLFKCTSTRYTEESLWNKNLAQQRRETPIRNPSPAASEDHLGRKSIVFIWYSHHTIPRLAPSGSLPTTTVLHYPVIALRSNMEHVLYSAQYSLNKKLYLSSTVVCAPGAK